MVKFSRNMVSSHLLSEVVKDIHSTTLFCCICRPSHIVAKVICVFVFPFLLEFQDLSDGAYMPFILNENLVYFT